jgi:hypothetical protein
LKNYIFSEANNLVALLLPLLLTLKMSTTDFLIRKLPANPLQTVAGNSYKVYSYLKQIFFGPFPHSNIHGVHPRKIGSEEFIDSDSTVSFKKKKKKKWLATC